VAPAQWCASYPPGDALMSALNVPLTISLFSTAFPTGPAYGDSERTTWGAFADVFWWRREGGKDGPNFVPARFTPEPDGRHVRRLGVNLVARTAVALDCETHKITGEIPPAPADVAERIRNRGWAAAVYTSHSHRPAAPRYRVLLPLSEEIDHELPAPEVIATTLGVDRVTDTSKYTAASLFYLPSTESAELDHHETITTDGAAIDAAWMREAACSILAERQAEQNRIAAVARAEAERRRQAKIAAGLDPDDSLIEKLRRHFDLEEVLLSHGYEKRTGRSGNKFRHPSSQSESYGANIKIFAGIERVFSHNAGDPLHRDNLPSWCSVTALDAIDATIILDFGGDRTKALAAFAERFGLNKAEQQKAVAALLFRMIRQQATQKAIEVAAYEKGERLGLSHVEIRRVAVWVASQLLREAA
jgi:hypothetical protein